VDPTTTTTSNTSHSKTRKYSSQLSALTAAVKEKSKAVTSTALGAEDLVL
jgi:hypothetical protein